MCHGSLLPVCVGHNNAILSVQRCAGGVAAVTPSPVPKGFSGLAACWAPSARSCAAEQGTGSAPRRGTSVSDTFWGFAAAALQCPPAQPLAWVRPWRAGTAPDALRSPLTLPKPSCSSPPGSYWLSAVGGNTKPAAGAKPQRSCAEPWCGHRRGTGPAPAGTAGTRAAGLAVTPKGDECSLVCRAPANRAWAGSCSVCPGYGVLPTPLGREMNTVESGERYTVPPHEKKADLGRELLSIGLNILIWSQSAWLGKQQRGLK